MNPPDLAAKYRAIAQEIRQDPSRWCQNHHAVCADGSSPPFSKDQLAVAWCAAGFTYRDDLPGVWLNLAVEQIGGFGYIRFNDTPGRKPEEVADLFDRAAALVEAESKETTA